MTDLELDTLVRNSLQRSPGRAADAGVWLPIEDPAVLASLARQQALVQLWFGVLRNAQGQILGMDVCLQQLQMRRSEIALYQLALELWGQSPLGDWLRGLQQRHPQLLALPQGACWLADAGPLIEGMHALGLLPNLRGAGGQPTGEDREVFWALRQQLLQDLLLAVPIERLDESLRELRLAIAVGL
ncbi:hypothetical protein N7668_23620 [Pseudomonas fulva]|uniref:hypothetical protein n=1 Tax=Pseudomonas fulva TaxID=47880 RepID=UPI00244B4708|nr:hypothetical protein [Pseudomonas fulva]MDH0574224.1 hypothetical protein [Pseudomonas fulva]